MEEIGVLVGTRMSPVRSSSSTTSRIIQHGGSRRSPWARCCSLGIGNSVILRSDRRVKGTVFVCVEGIYGRFSPGVSSLITRAYIQIRVEVYGNQQDFSKNFLIFLYRHRPRPYFRHWFSCCSNMKGAVGATRV